MVEKRAAVRQATKVSFIDGPGISVFTVVLFVFTLTASTKKNRGGHLRNQGVNLETKFLYRSKCLLNIRRTDIQVGNPTYSFVVLIGFIVITAGQLNALLRKIRQ